MLGLPAGEGALPGAEFWDAPTACLRRAHLRGTRMTLDDVVARMGWARLPDLRVAQLSGGITNTNYRVDAGHESFVVRIPGRGSQRLGIDRDREHACTRAAAASGVAPPVAAFFPEGGVLVTRFVSGREPTAAEMHQPGALRRVAAALRGYHEGPEFPGRFSPFDTVRDYAAAVGPSGAPIPARFDQMMERVERIEASLASAGLRPCHNDLLLGNFLDGGGRLWVLDWEYAAMGDLFFDLGNFAANLQLDETAERELLDAYFGRVTARAAARLGLMRIVSELREAMWAAVQMTISEIEYDFAAYGRTHFERFAAGLADQRVPNWLRDASGPA